MRACSLVLLAIVGSTVATGSAQAQMNCEQLRQYYYQLVGQSRGDLAFIQEVQQVHAELQACGQQQRYRQSTLHPGASPCGQGYCNPGYVCLANSQCQSLDEINREAAARRAQEEEQKKAAQAALKQWQKKQDDLRKAQTANALTAVSSLFGAFGGAAQPGKINVPGELPNGRAGIAFAQQNAVRMTNYSWNPLGSAQTDPFAARVDLVPSITTQPAKVVQAPPQPSPRQSYEYNNPSGYTGFQQNTGTPYQPTWTDKATDWIRSHL